MTKKKKKKNISDQKPPDQYRCIKLPLKSIVDNDLSINTIFEHVMRTHRITIKTYQLLKLWIIEKYNQTNDIPEITLDTIKMAQKTLLIPSSGPKPKGNNLQIFNEFKQCYQFQTEDGCHLSQVLQYTATSILTMIENNIKQNFFTYIRRFINAYFKNIYKERLENSNDKKQFISELNTLKNDIINGTDNCADQYKEWLEDNRYNVVPETFKENYYYDIQCYPQKYLKHMLWMNIQLEQLDAKMFQSSPLRSDIIPKAIQIDTKTLVTIFMTDQNTYLKDIEGNKDKIWNSLFTIKLRMKDYVFDHTIITDGYSASVRFVHKAKLVEVNQRKQRMKQGKLLTKDEKEEQKLMKAEDKKQNLITKKNETEYVDFMYIDEIDKDSLKGKKKVYIDPGMRSLFYMMDDNGNVLNYTNKQRTRETKRLKYQRIIHNHRDKLNITEIEKEFHGLNAKTCNPDKFREYIAIKNKTNEQLLQLYSEPKFRQYKWYGHINRKRCEDNMLNLIEKKYGKDAVLCIGDASLGKHMRGLLSTPNIAVKRKLKERFETYHVDEFRSSCLHHETEERCKNLYYKDTKKRNILKKRLKDYLKNKKEEELTIEYMKNYLNGKDKSRKLHSVLTYQMENQRYGCINRDKNACLNIKKIVNYYINTGSRPLRYSRNYDLKKEGNLPQEINQECQMSSRSSSFIKV